MESTEWHEAFKKALWDSQPAVAAVAGFFIKRGYAVDVPALYVPDTFEEGISDSGDMRVHAMNGERWHIVEVKYRHKWDIENMIGFKGQIVEKVKRLEAKENTPSLYMFVDKHNTHALMFNFEKDRESMYAVPVKDHITDILEDTWHAPTDLCTGPHLL